MTIDHNVLPDIGRSDADTVLVVEAPVTAEIFDELERKPWPDGLISVSTYAATDGETALTYTQWAAGATGREFLSGLTGAEPVEYRLYRSGTRENPPVPGCVVVVSVEFDGPDPQRQRRWVDTVFDALAGETDPPPGGISGHFHVSTDGTKVLNYAEWTDEQAHRDALARSGQGTVGTSPGWQRVQAFPGVRNSGFRRHHLARSVSVAPSAEEVLDSPTAWVAEHIRAYVETDGESGHFYQGWPTLLLTTRGRKSGTLRRTALIYGQDADRYLLVGSNSGAPTHPAWYLNAVAHPEITVQVAGDTFTARARTATAEEKRLLWPRMASIFPLYDDYQAKADRDIPLVIIERHTGETP
ncbi:nitroreductase family deazaflavin-dependent oxidoreductase [Lentzea sp. BCCO 10_0856]|uniref:Nitroreductase family deazaflavin-dependent oxidoreductase n=1 Tax=Lentzea miocenica TaxID=3095431 RepID=A0ABU4TD89_9PSEU|nr:nitroreductase family deazaflavin-dependent oxidoreductase [Lentzea sp. BCCO 10_0856]MDX8036025.1 nitroreductase family deazaflavin-dependent oxidoreductase [Lentzea sp. BCCO 10_0856]